jgi:SpoVK/Ycf46/Vps4 family AAA+-type ATPase
MKQNATAQSEIVVPITIGREHKTSDTSFSNHPDFRQISENAMPFANNYEYLDALEKEALLILALSAVRRGKTDWTLECPAGERLYVWLGLSPGDFEIDKMESMLAQRQQINESRRKASIHAGVKLFFSIFCHENKLDAFDEKIILLLFMNVTSERFREMFSLCRLDEDKRGIKVHIILSALCSDYREQLEKRSHFSRNAPLVKREIIFFHTDYGKTSSHIMDETATINERHVRYIVGDSNLYNSTYKEITIESSNIKLANVIMPDNVKEQIVGHVDKYLRERESVNGSRLDDFLEYGTALTLFFHGPSGTGKTMMAKALAHQFNRQLITVKLDDMHDYWRLEYLMIQAFREAALLHGFVFFDEADDIFKEGSYLTRSLLIQLEKARCVVIFATNKATRIDPAMERRLSMKIYFPLPDAEKRLKIWQALLPEFIKLAPDIDLKSLNIRYPFSGGLIKNTIFMAANAAGSDRNGNYKISREILEQAANLQTQQMMDNNKYCRTYVPLKKVDNLPLTEKQRSELKNIAKAFQYSQNKNSGLNILISGTNIDTGIQAVDALAVECGLKVKAFKFGDLNTLCKDYEVTDGVSHEKVKLIDYAFSQTTEEAHLLLIIDYNGVINWIESGNPNDMDVNLTSSNGVATFLNHLREYRGFCCLVMHECPKTNTPLEFHAHLKLEYPPEEMQMEHWKNNLLTSSLNDRDLVALVEQHPMHISEIDSIVHRASILSLIEGKPLQPSLETVKTVIARYRGRNNAPVLFGGK